MMVFVIVAPAGLLKVPPRLSPVCCANAGAHETIASRIKNPQRLTRNLFLFIFVSSITVTVTVSKTIGGVLFYSVFGARRARTSSNAEGRGKVFERGNSI
jgi:hypothetical protein